MISPFKLIGKLWRQHQRNTDLKILWPVCREHARTLDAAKYAFYVHASMDTAWTKDYDSAELHRFIDQLK